MYEEMKFDLDLEGISDKQLDVHLKLYSGYVKHSNLIKEQIEELKKDEEKNSFIISELKRRFGYEFDGMRNHEIYFHTLEGDRTASSDKSTLYVKLAEQFGSFDEWLEQFKKIGTTRGNGWVALYWDRHAKNFINTWVDEHHIGVLTQCDAILLMDVWEHAFMVDFTPSTKKDYIETFFKNLNWRTVEDRAEKFLV
jgi:Fe-Mn family superoxide dismutase